MALKGTLRDFKLPDIFQLIGIQQKTGVLTLKHEQEVVTVSFVGGSVVGAEALHRRLENRLGTVLVKTGQITEAQLQEALKIQKETLNRLGNVLVDHQLIDIAALREALQIQISQTVFRLFRWQDGEFNFSQETRVDYEKKYVVPIPAENILMEGARILDEWPMIEKGIRSFSAVYRRADVEIAPGAAGGGTGGGETSAEGAVTLNREERIVHTLIDGRRSVQEVVERSLLGEFETCRILFELINRQLVEEVKAPVKRAARETAPPPVRRLAPVAQGFAYMFLVLIAGGGVMYRSQSWVGNMARGERAAAIMAPILGSSEIESLQAALDSDRLLKIDFAVQVYFLLNRSYPPVLSDLVSANLLTDKDIIDSEGNRYRYDIVPEGYSLSADDGP